MVTINGSQRELFQSTVVVANKIKHYFRKEYNVFSFWEKCIVEPHFVFLYIKSVTL